MGLTVRSSRLMRDPSRALSIYSSSMYNESFRGGNATKMSSFHSDRHKSPSAGYGHANLYALRKDSISLLKKGSGTGGGKIQNSFSGKPNHQRSFSVEDPQYNSITLHNTSTLSNYEDPIISKLEAKIYRGSKKDPSRYSQS